MIKVLFMEDENGWKDEGCVLKYEVVKMWVNRWMLYFMLRVY